MEDQPKEKKKYVYSKEKIREYNKRFYDSHKEPIQCELCYTMYKYHNKHNHIQSKIHQAGLNIYSKVVEETLNETNTSNSPNSN